MEPFLGFIRAHEKQFAREIGVLKVQLSESKALVDRLRMGLELYLEGTKDNRIESYSRNVGIVQKLFSRVNESSWIFDTSTLVNLFIFVITKYPDFIITIVST